ncbi:hypothetical protein HDU98_004746 [Podochytrium sp. JEL0797]|nr:hypothetical protein HDU98_004746 [Podochytrium sp. JEL0797]
MLGFLAYRIHNYPTAPPNLPAIAKPSETDIEKPKTQLSPQTPKPEKFPSHTMTMSYIRDDVTFVKPIPKKHPQRSSIQHWQLRDLISCPQTRKEFYSVNQNTVSKYNTETQTSTAVMKDLTFAPSSMATGEGYIAAGGQRSQLTVRQLNSNWFAQATVGGSINNAMCISAHGGDAQLLICNNDETIKVYTLPGLQRLTTITLPTAVNHASVSPDGTKLCAVGDSNQVYLYDVTANGGYQKIQTLTGL